MKPLQNSARAWLLENGYPEVAKMIDEIMAEWKAKGKKTRRDWWDALAGGKHGNPCVIEGRTFPVLRAARIRKGWTVTSNCLALHKRETFPAIVAQVRWQPGGMKKATK